MTQTAASRKGIPTSTVPPTSGSAEVGAPTRSPATERPLIFVNGRMLPKSQATVSVYDHGLLYGDGVFEGIRVYRGRIFKSRQHMDRLWKSADGIRSTTSPRPMPR